MNKIHEWVNTGLLALAVLLIALVLVGSNQSVPVHVGGSTSDDWNVGGALVVDGASTLTGATTHTGDVTFNGGAGAINAPTALGATSTLTVGGIQMYATSAATRICVRPSIDGSAATSSFSGTMFWNYGACL